MVSMNKEMKLPALEKNILKYRALEMTIILFHAESLKRFIIASIRATDKLSNRKNSRIPEGTKDVLQKAFDIMINENILTQNESDELQSLIDYRNDIAHRIHLLTCDINHPEKHQDHLNHLEVKYNYDALGKFEYYRSKIEKGLQSGYVMSISPDTLFFENAENTYKEELNRLRKRINRQFDIRRQRINNYKTNNSKDSTT
jgi:hypothetical protein